MSTWRCSTLINKRFGRLLVQQLAPKLPGVRTVRSWICLCDCGKTAIVPTGRLNSGNTRSCGCLQQETIHPNMIGRRFGKLVVVEPAGMRKHHCAWLCQCDCGDKVVIRTCHLKAARTCGCGKYSGGKRLSAEDAAYNLIMRTYVDNANKKKIPFELSRGECFKLFKSPCHYCNASPSTLRLTKSRKLKGVYYNGIDRKINTEDYTPANVVSCCKQCNYIKGAMNYDQFRQWIFTVAANLTVNAAEGQLVLQG